MKNLEKKIMFFALFKSQRWPLCCSLLPSLLERLGERPLMLWSLENKTMLTVEEGIVLHITTNKWGEICFILGGLTLHGLSV